MNLGYWLYAAVLLLATIVITVLLILESRRVKRDMAKITKLHEEEMAAFRALDDRMDVIERGWRENR